MTPATISRPSPPSCRTCSEDTDEEDRGERRLTRCGLPHMIVVAENDDGTRTVLSSALARFGYDVSSVTDGQLVLSTLETGKVHLLILDLRMPGMNGWEVLRR